MTTDQEVCPNVRRRFIAGESKDENRIAMIVGYWTSRPNARAKMHTYLSFRMTPGPTWADIMIAGHPRCDCPQAVSYRRTASRRWLHSTPRPHTAHPRPARADDVARGSEKFDHRTTWVFIIGSVCHLLLGDAWQGEWLMANLIYALGLASLLAWRGAAVGWAFCAVGLLAHCYSCAIS